MKCRKSLRGSRSFGLMRFITHSGRCYSERVWWPHRSPVRVRDESDCGDDRVQPDHREERERRSNAGAPVVRINYNRAATRSRSASDIRRPSPPSGRPFTEEEDSVTWPWSFGFLFFSSSA